MAHPAKTQLPSTNPQAEELPAEGSEALSTIINSVRGVQFSPPIPPEDFELGRMKPLSYTREALSAAIVHNVRRSLDSEQLWITGDGFDTVQGPKIYLQDKSKLSSVEVPRTLEYWAAK
jgi:hypothetical protein